MTTDQRDPSGKTTTRGSQRDSSVSTKTQRDSSGRNSTQGGRRRADIGSSQGSKRDSSGKTTGQRDPSGKTTTTGNQRPSSASTKTQRDSSGKITTQDYFLAERGQSCDNACSDKELFCDLSKLETAATNSETCRDIIESLGVTIDKGGMFPDEGDYSGCSYANHADGDRWYFLLKPGYTELPTCSGTPATFDNERQRVCACSALSKTLLVPEPHRNM